MSSVNLTFQDVKPVFDAWLPSVQSVLRVGFALQRDNDIQLIHSITLLSPVKQPPFVPLDVATKSMLAHRSLIQLSPDNRDKTLRQIIDAPHKFVTPSWSAELTTTPPDPDIFRKFDLIRTPRAGVGPDRAPAIVCTARRKQFFATLDQLDLELMAMKSPFNGLSDLLSSLILPVQANLLFDASTLATTEIILGPPVTLEEPFSIASNEIDLKFVADEPIKKEQLSVSVKAFPSIGPVEYLHPALDSLSWKSGKDGRFRANVRVSVPNAPLVQAFISLRGEFLGLWRFTDPSKSYNSNLQLHRAVDQTDEFRRTFFEVKPNDFEDRVNLLLNLAGLQTLKHGQIGSLRSKSPDILALTADRRILFVVECTTGDIDKNGKLQNLAERTRAISEHLQGQPNQPAAVQAVVVTPEPRRETIPHWKIASAKKIAIVAQEDLQTILSRLEFPFEQEQLRESIAALIPQHDDTKAG